MWQYDWPAWIARVKSFKGEWALERWLLMYLHEQKSTDALALAVMEKLIANGQNAHVRVQSIWVDGTPQAEFSPKDHLPHVERPQCELADLLLCVRLEAPNGQLQREHAVLIQAKVATKYNVLPGGDSTKTERELFENCDRDQNITLYAGVNKGTPIGVYKLGNDSDNQAYGLRDCASFLLMAIAPWAKTTAPIAPLQIGWPLDTSKKKIDPPESFLNAIVNMVSGTTMRLGREVKTDASAMDCVWTKMVNDLRGKYQPVLMKGYNGQARIRTSSATVSSPHLVFSLLGKYPRGPNSTNQQRQSWLLMSLPYLLGDTLRNRIYHRLMGPKKSLIWPDGLVRVLVENMKSGNRFNLWPDNPSTPPPSSTKLIAGSGPHISTLVVTIRSTTQDFHPD